jgi:hypothetical protein
MRRPLTSDEFKEALRTYEHTAFRLELQPRYAEPVEDEHVARFLAGDPIVPTDDPAFVAWYDQVAAQVAAGKRMERVRVQEDPPTPYQQWERWVGKWNEAAGEVLRYMTRADAHAIGLLPTAGNEDWWLLDSARLIVMRFDGDGNRVGDELTDEPARVVQACMWRDLANHHSAPEARGHAA